MTLVGKAAYSSVLGGQMGSGAQKPSVAGYEAVDLKSALAKENFEINPDMADAYKVDKDKNGAEVYRDVSKISGGFGMINESNKDKYRFDINEVGLSELEARKAGITTQDFGDYKTSIVVLGRVNSEGRDYLPGEDGLKGTGVGENNEGAKDPLGLSNREREMIKMAKEKGDKTIS